MIRASVTLPRCSPGRAPCRVYRPVRSSPADLPEKNGHVLVHRPGQVVALDTTVLPVMVRDGGPAVYGAAG
jgi:hypothetical protein